MNKYAQMRPRDNKGKFINDSSFKVKRICLTCQKQLFVHPCRIRAGKGKYCSIKCSPTVFKLGNNGVWFGKKRPDLKNTNAFKTMFKKGETVGEKNANWQGGLTLINFGIRHSWKYRLWRNKVLKRDNYTCQLCNSRDKKIHVDHIKPFSKYPELRMDFNNVRTLCVECHRKTPTYSGKAGVVREVMFNV